MLIEQLAKNTNRAATPGTDALFCRDRRDRRAFDAVRFKRLGRQSPEAIMLSTNYPRSALRHAASVKRIA